MFFPAGAKASPETTSLKPTVTGMLDQVIAWGGALKPLRGATSDWPRWPRLCDAGGGRIDAVSLENRLRQAETDRGNLHIGRPFRGLVTASFTHTDAAQGPSTIRSPATSPIRN